MDRVGQASVGWAGWARPSSGWARPLWDGPGGPGLCGMDRVGQASVGWAGWARPLWDGPGGPGLCGMGRVGQASVEWAGCLCKPLNQNITWSGLLGVSDGSNYDMKPSI